MIELKEIDGVKYAVLPTGDKYKKEEWPQVKEAFITLLKEQGFVDLNDKPGLLKAKEKLINEGSVIDVGKIPVVETTPLSSLTTLPEGTDFVEHAKSEVDRANDEYKPGEGGGFLISSQHVEFQNTVNGSVFVFSDKVVDMATAMKMALRTNKPLTNKVVQMTMAMVVKLKQDPTEETPDE